jgi:hypothetical protein
MRCGASSSTTARVSCASRTTAASRSPALDGRNPANTKPPSSDITPATLNAAVTLLAPGSGTMRNRRRARPRQPRARVAHGRRSGVAGIGHALPGLQPLHHGLGRFRFVVLVHGEQLRCRFVDAVGTQHGLGMARVLAGHRRRRSGDRCSARRLMSARLPIGVATT